LIVTRLTVLFAKALDSEKTVLLTGSFGVVIRQAPLAVRNPDVAVWRKDKLIVQDALAHSTPELAVEVLSPSNTRKEMDRKLRDYAEIAVPEVWLLSPEALTVEVLRLRDGEYRDRRIINEGALSPAAFPEAAIDVTAIWEE
jgi:Uma2 family endonuclease